MVKRRKRTTKNKKQKRNSSNPHLHEEIIFNILTRLPAESILKFRYVSKSWFSMISNPYFIDKFISKSEPELLIQTVTGSGSLGTAFLYLEGGSRPTLRKTSSLSEEGQIKASCNGLVLIQNSDDHSLLHVTNPVTNQWVALPPCSPFPANRNFGFGYSTSTREHKVIYICNHHTVQIQILTLCNDFNETQRCFGTWRHVDGPYHDLDASKAKAPIMTNGGILHWNIGSIKYVVSMDVYTEKVYKTCLPEIQINEDNSPFFISEMSGVLGFVTFGTGGMTDIWVSNGLKKLRWIKQYTVKTPVSRAMIHSKDLQIASLGNGGYLTFTCGHYLVVYDVKLQGVKKIKVNSGKFTFFGTHISSIVTLRS